MWLSRLPGRCLFPFRQPPTGIISRVSKPQQPENFKDGILIPATYTSGEEIFLDGMDNESPWSATPEVTVPLSFGTVESAQLKALYTDEDILLRIRWADATEDRLHHPWVWDEELGNYKVGPQIEDSLMLSFEHGCRLFRIN